MEIKNALLELVKIGKGEGEENNFHAPELCVVNIKLFVDEERSYKFDVKTTGLSQLTLTENNNRELGVIEVLIDWLNTVDDKGNSNRSKVYDFVKEKFKAQKQLNQKLDILNK